MRLLCLTQVPKFPTRFNDVLKRKKKKEREKQFSLRTFTKAARLMILGCLVFNPFTAVMPFRNNKSATLKTLQTFCVFFFALTRERVFIKTQSTESRCATRPEKYTVYKRVRASFSPEMLQAESVTELIICAERRSKVRRECAVEAAVRKSCHAVLYSERNYRQPINAVHLTAVLRDLA